MILVLITKEVPWFKPLPSDQKVSSKKDWRLGCSKFESIPNYSSTVVIQRTLMIAGKGTNTSRIILIAVVPSVGLTFIITLICLFRKRVHKEKSKFNLDTIIAATSDFSDANRLGRGGFGDVYKGVLSDGKEIAVKRLSRKSDQGELEFKNEVLLLAKLQHRNLVRLLGFCLAGEERLLIYEFLPKSSLDHFIFDPINRAQLDWDKRYKIIEGIARGLLYLHEDSHFRIIHRDLKASNILLDANMNPKISDFGMAKLFTTDQSHAKASRIAGTYGYMAPEYAYKGHFSVKSDIYSFGVLILEIVSGQKICFHEGEELEHLVCYAWRKWREGNALDIVDPTLGDKSRSEIMRFIQIALLCVQQSVTNRPTIASIVSIFNSYSFPLPAPLRPGFFTHSTTQKMEHNSHVNDVDHSDRNSAHFSTNGDSSSEIHPR
ncbi:putative receptor-like protein kinase [Vitis vinifera]|uniref:Putative receptor-like protein kinase n=1 Tax=Vitis vinifera TaxID=29760 RepID=A0A438J7A4_VITVI|nr:putative receptor-like protein kinase [Vitis vinifera]